MKKRATKLYLFVLVSFSLISLLTTIVIAQDTVLDRLIGPGGLSGVFENLSNSNLFAKTLLFILVALIVYAVAGSLPMMRGDKTYIAALISIVVALLATFFLKSQEINTILLSYGALGITLTGILPFVLIMIIAKQLADAGYGFLNRVIWAVFLIVTGVRWLTATPEDIGTFGTVVYPIIIAAVIIMFAIDKKFWKWFKRGRREGFKEKVEEAAHESVAGAEAMSTIARGLGGRPQKRK